MSRPEETMAALRLNPRGLTTRELAELFGIASSHAGGIVKRLVAQGQIAGVKDKALAGTTLWRAA